MEKNISLYCRYKNGIEALYKLRDKRANEKKIVPFVIWLAGFTECGKTKIAMEIANWVDPSKLPFMTSDNLKWFD